MVVLDIAIVNVALPSIQTDLGFSQESLQWVVSAYALFFGGFLLLGGRVSDIVGRRRVFVAGLIVFTGASLLSGLAWSEGALIGARALQGLGAAMITPAALSILSTTFAEGKERNAALGAWGAVGAFGAVAGVLLGGVLTDALSWEWIFFVNIPVGVAGLVLAPILLNESRDARVKSFDVPGAVLVTSGLVVLVYATHARQPLRLGLDRDDRTLHRRGGAARLLPRLGVADGRAADAVLDLPAAHGRRRERRRADPRDGALRDVPRCSRCTCSRCSGTRPCEPASAYLAVAGTAILWSGVAAQLVNRVGVKPVLVAGMAFMSAGLLYFTQVSVGGSYLGDLLPGFLLISIGMGFSFVPISIAALAGVQPAEAGLASGLINTSQQIGGALGIAVLSAVASSSTNDALASGSSLPVALTDGFHAAFYGAAAVALVGVLVALFVVRREDLVEESVDAVPALEAA